MFHGVAKSWTGLSDWADYHLERISVIKGHRAKHCVFWLPSPSVIIAAAKLLQSCPSLCDPIGGSPPGSPVPGILQARTPEWAAISFSNAWKWKVKVRSLSRVWLLATPWTAAYQAPPSMGVSRQEYWSGCQVITEYSLEGIMPKKKKKNKNKPTSMQHNCCNIFLKIPIHVKMWTCAVSQYQRPWVSSIHQAEGTESA